MGAALGRHSYLGLDPDYAGTIYVRRIRLDRRGYDRLGTYWGIGAPLYWIHSSDLRVDHMVRANTRAGAAFQAKRLCPKAKVRV